MADVLTANRQAGFLSRLRGALPAAGFVAVTLFALWLTADQEIVAQPTPHDDQWYLRAARHAYWFEGGSCSSLSFIKEPVYPLFVGLCFRLGLPLHLMTELVYLAAAGFLVWALVYRQAPTWVGLLLFAICAVHPLSHITFRRSTADGVYVSLLLAALAALLLQHKRRGEPGGWRRGLLSGTLLGLLWNTRPERPLVLVLLLFFVAMSAVAVWRRGPTYRAARAWMGEWVIPAGALAALALAVMTANYARWGVFATTAQNAPGLNAAYRALLSIHQERPMRRVPVTREARELAAAVSPTYRELELVLQGQLGKNWGQNSRASYPTAPPGELVTSFFNWALMDAVVLVAGQAGPPAEAFFQRVAAELNAAAADGRLPTRTVMPYGLDPCPEHYLPHLGASWRKLWTNCVRPWPPEKLGDVPGPHVPEFDRIAGRRSIAPAPGGQARVRGWIASAYSAGLEAALLAAALVALVVLLVRRAALGRGPYFLAGAALGVAALARLAMFAVLHAGAYVGVTPHYLFPAALTMTVMAVWLVADGLRLLLRPKVRTHESAVKSQQSDVGYQQEDFSLSSDSRAMSGDPVLIA